MLILNVNVFNKSAFAKSETVTYAKALSNCVLYKSIEMGLRIDDMFFVVPETYFVTVLETVSDECLKVQYDKFIGYVKATSVVIATFVPIVKTLSGVTVDVKETSGTQVWNIPSSNGKVLTTISAGEKQIKYISYVYGEIPSGGQSNLWYYVAYTPIYNSTSVYEGYVYSENMINLSDIVLNNETNQELITEENLMDKTIYISPTLKTILITIVCVPIILLFLIILYKFSKKIQKNTKKDNNSNNKTFENNSFSTNDLVDKYKYNPHLKKELGEMKNTSYVKKHTLFNKRVNYPAFPSYESDDDLLWVW